MRTFWYYLYVNMTKWQASRNLIYLYKLQKGTKIKKINNNNSEILQKYMVKQYTNGVSINN